MTFMTEQLMDLIKYAIVGTGLFILIIVGIRALCHRRAVRHKARKEIKCKQKVSGKEQRRQTKANKKESKKANKKTRKKTRRQKKKRKPVKILEKVKRILPKKQSTKKQSIKKKNVTKEKVKAITLYFYNLEANAKWEEKKFIMQDDVTLSNHHCKIYQRDEKLYIIDLNVANDTYVNDQRITGEVLLSSQDKIRIGQSEYRIEFK